MNQKSAPREVHPLSTWWSQRNGFWHRFDPNHQQFPAIPNTARGIKPVSPNREFGYEMNLPLLDDSTVCAQPFPCQLTSTQAMAGLHPNMDGAIWFMVKHQGKWSHKQKFQAKILFCQLWFYCKHLWYFI